MRAGDGWVQVHMVCPRLLELDRRHGEHLAGQKYPATPPHRHSQDCFEPCEIPEHRHGRKCGCLIDHEGHSVTTLVIPPGEAIAADHALLRCRRCGQRMVEGEHISGPLIR